MKLAKHATALGPAFLSAIERKGFTELTEVQRAVLAPELLGKNLRITSQTGSGKTVAVGFVLRDLVSVPLAAPRGVARPRALIIAPTRELARQIEQELRWLYADTQGRFASATGGASYRDEARALGAGPSAVIGTPGRLLDHLKRGAIDATQVGAVVIDEADRMLDMGFREELEAILAFVPAERATHLMSATFPRDVRALADAVQSNPAHVQGTRLGVANADIDHVLHIVDPRRKTDAMVNLLLAHPEEQCLVFVRMRTDASHVAKELASAGFAASSLSGEMDQTARNRALAAFKAGALRVLVATDVAARGIDVQDIARVIHVELPTNPDAYTHRSGRTGRAGRKGTSSLLVAPADVVHATRLLRVLGVEHRFEPIPGAQEIRRAADERVFISLTADDAADEDAVDPRVEALVERIVAAGAAERSLKRLLKRTRFASEAEPRDLPSPDMPSAHDGKRSRSEHGPRSQGRRGADTGWVPFRVSWGAQHGADARKLLAMVCRRGEIRGQEVGAIRVERNFSIVEVAAHVAESFAAAAARPDPRDPRLLIERDRFEKRSRQAPSRAVENTPRARPGAPTYDNKGKKGEFLKRRKIAQGFPFERGPDGASRKKKKGKDKGKKEKALPVNDS
jgi:ATP-dependent RNA helicase DeaD